MGKVRMGYHTGEVRWGLMTIFRLVSIALELSLNFISFVVYPGFCLKIIRGMSWIFWNRRYKSGVNVRNKCLNVRCYRMQLIICGIIYYRK